MARHLLPWVVSAAAAALAVTLLAPRAAGYPWPSCGDSNSFEVNSTFQANLNRVAAALPGNASSSPTLFATAAAGAIPDRVWAMGLCRGDVGAATCLSCLAQAFQDLPNYCAYAKDATIYYDPCALHYSGVHVLPGDDDTGPLYDVLNVYNLRNVTSDPARFDRLLGALLAATADYAAYNSSRRFATGEGDFDDQAPRKVYTVAQCTPDQTPAQCRSCLARLVAESMDVYRGHIGGRVLWISCTYRFETAPFYNGPAMVRLSSSSSSGVLPPAPSPVVQPTPVAAGGGGRKFRVPVLVPAVVLPTLAALNLAACLCFWRRRRQPSAQSKQPYPTYSAEASDIETVESMLMDLSTLRTATGGFAESNKLGQGGFGAVYKGVLPDGDEVAVKRLSSRSTQGVAEELKNELALVAKLKHRNLVRLVGVCLEQQERLLVYEFVPNRSLDLILFDPERSGQLDWAQRFQIITGIARGLQYLHEDSQLKVVHRDLKASNILLDASMSPKIADFGVARMFGRDQTRAVTSRVIGTYGYMAPEYATRGSYSAKSDAFGFGVVVLEIVTGRRSNDGQWTGDLLAAVWEHWEAGTVVPEMVDPAMGGGGFPEGDVLRSVHIALLCVQGDPAARPMMSSVVAMLGTDTITLQAPSKPAFFAGNGAIANTAVSTVSLQG